MTSPTHWEYRLFKENFGDTVEITIREVYFDEAGRPLTATIRGVGPMGETTEELKEDIAMMMTAFDLPIMSDADFSEAGAPCLKTCQTPALQGIPRIAQPPKTNPFPMTDKKKTAEAKAPQKRRKQAEKPGDAIKEKDPIAYEIKRAREAKDMSISDLSRLTGISRPVLLGYEAGRTRPGSREIRLISGTASCG